MTSANGSGSAADPFELPIFVRAYAEEVGDRGDDGDDAKVGGGVIGKGKEHPLGGWTFCFDTETTTDPAQRLRIGFYQLREGDRLDEERVLYDPEALSAAEIETVRRYADAYGLGEPMTLADFRSEALIKRGLEIGATIVTFNGPFDFARVALDAGPARATKWRPKMRGGFSLRLSDRSSVPHIQVKALNSRAAMVELSAPRRQNTSRSRRKRNDYAPSFRGYFVDVKTLASALLTGNFSLERLTKKLGTPTLKHHSDAHGEKITFDYLDYARSDVKATWECYRVLADKYHGYGLSAPITSIISEASIGKATLDTMGVMPWLQTQPGGADAGLVSLIMSSYFGGRTEVRIRRQVVRVLHTDFTSMYPTVCTLQGLMAFVVGQGFTRRDATEEARAFLAEATPATFQDQTNWRRLAVLVRVQPDDDLYPIRAEYGRRRSATIGLNYLTYDGSLWFTLADCLAAKFLSGKTPEILEALAFEPGPMQPGLQPIQLMGGRQINPKTQDFYRELICERERLEASKAGKLESEQVQIEEQRQAYKITANATSYGIFAQTNVTSEPRGVMVRVYRPDGAYFERRSKKVEKPGPWFHPLVATLITGAARLMLALAERQVMDVGLGWAFCDTDSLAIAKPDGMAEDDFRQRAVAVVEWFRPLNPYGFDAPILKIEDVNSAADGGDTPLYCWAISSKRYALFNIGPDGAPIIRKASAHGLGHLVPPYSPDDAPSHLPPPLKGVLSGKEKLQRWQYDAWVAILSAGLAGRPDDARFDYHENLRLPTVSRYTASSPALLGWMASWNGDKPYAESVKPFGFLLIPHPTKKSLHPDHAPDPIVGTVSRTPPSPIAPFHRDIAVALDHAIDRKSGQPIERSGLETYREVLRRYPRSSEPKFLNGHGISCGRTERCHVHATDITFIGKEADRWEEAYFLGIGEDMTVQYGRDPAAQSDVAAQLRNMSQVVGKAAVAKATGVSRGALDKIVKGEAASVRIPRGRILKALDRLKTEREISDRRRAAQAAFLRNAIREHGGLRRAARALGLDPSNLSKQFKNAHQNPNHKPHNSKLSAYLFR